jgi:hypothetical protein
VNRRRKAGGTYLKKEDDLSALLAGTYDSALY